MINTLSPPPPISSTTSRTSRPSYWRKPRCSALTSIPSIRSSSVWWSIWLSYANETNLSTTTTSSSTYLQCPSLMQMSRAGRHGRLSIPSRSKVSEIMGGMRRVIALGTWTYRHGRLHLLASQLEVMLRFLTTSRWFKWLFSKLIGFLIFTIRSWYQLMVYTMGKMVVEY